MGLIIYKKEEVVGNQHTLLSLLEILVRILEGEVTDFKYGIVIDPFIVQTNFKCSLYVALPTVHPGVSQNDFYRKRH